MKNTNNPQDKSNGKAKAHSNQLQTIFQYLEKEVATASMVSEATGVLQRNI